MNFVCREEKLLDRLVSLNLPPVVENAPFETFISRAMISGCSKSELSEEIPHLKIKFCEFLLRRLIDCATSGHLEPTQLCYCLRALAESLEYLTKKKVAVSGELYHFLGEKKFFGKFGEHPLDVVRVNAWKIYKMAHEEKFKNIDSQEEYFKNEVKRGVVEKIYRFNIK